MTLNRSLDQLEGHIERHPGVYVRVLSADGSSVEGEILDVAPTHLLLLNSATGKQVQISRLELHAIDVEAPRRGREWLLAAFAIVGAPAVLVGLARFSGLQPELSAPLGFVALMAIVAGVGAIPAARKRVFAWLTRWQRLYPAVEP
jgi:hypothetical protein